MKYLFYILILISIFSFKKGNEDILIHASVLRTYDSVYYEYFIHDTAIHKTYDIRLTVINNSNKTVSYCLMSCSWFESFLPNVENISILGWGCDRNGPIEVILKPNDSLIYNFKAYHTGFGFHDCTDTRFGLIYIDLNEGRNWDDYFLIRCDKSKWSIIWSNPLYLNEN